MIVVSDTNILSSLAAGDALPALLQVFRRSPFCIPPSVQDELQVGLAKGRTYLAPIFRAITTQQIVVVALSAAEEHAIEQYPQRLNLGERQAIALAQTRNAVVLSNDRRALRYCQQQNIRVVNLIDILRLFWRRQVMSQAKVQTVLTKTVGHAHPTAEDEAEACFLKAIDIAQKQQAKSLELRAVISLARLRQQQAQEHATRTTQHSPRIKLDEAHRMLSDIYNWFTEGFDTKDLQEAKAVLAELAAKSPSLQ